MKQLPERHVLSDRGFYACGMEPSIVKFTELFHKIEASGLTPEGIMTVYHENIMDFDRAKSDLEYCVMLESIGLETAPIRTLPQGDYITARYCGIPNDTSCKKIYSKLQDWIETHGYIESGDPIEYYIVDRAQMLKPEDFIVELQVPVRKVLTL
ncbi:GyrI-like domain-containing protein [Paenibacillus monticola]|nr:GyrI-like domain-containing protein [Paenibacillus monticola]